MDRAQFPAAPLIREIGRGAHGSRALTREQSASLMAAILDGAVSELELGAVLIALRMKGETAVEIAGFLDALEPHLVRVPSQDHSVGVGHRADVLPGVVAVDHEVGRLDPVAILSQTEPMTGAIDAYKAFDERQPGWLKVELEPAG